MARFHLENAIAETVGYLDRVRERELSHVIRITPELEAAGDLRTVAVGADVRHLPFRGVGDQAVNRLFRAVTAIVVQLRG